MKPILVYALIIISVLTYTTAIAAVPSPITKDPHYNEAGFFDIHICNWPQRPYFFKVLFSSAKYQQIKKMTVSSPDHQLLATLDPAKFRLLKRKGKPDKHVYILDINIPDHATTGWYVIDVLMKDGKSYQAKDYVIMSKLDLVSKMTPANEATVEQLPLTLKWKAITGAQYYKAFIRDEWTGQLVYSSPLQSSTEIIIPDNKLEAGGYYSWSVHARDTNEHVLLGDFHMGSISKKSFFTIID